MEKINDNWYSASIRKGVYCYDLKLNPMSAEFKEWWSHRLGQLKIYNGGLYFENQQDLVEYLLTFDEMSDKDW